MYKEQTQRAELEKELAELKNRPPPITPRGQQQPHPPQPQQIKDEPKQKGSSSKQQQQSQQKNNTIEIYLPEYCPMTFKAVQTNPNHLTKFKQSAREIYENDLDEFGIDLKDTCLSDTDFKQKIKKIATYRRQRSDDMTSFNELRKVFSELAEKYATQKLLGQSLRSSIGNRVHFKKEIENSNNNKNKVESEEEEHSNWNDSVSQPKEPKHQPIHYNNNNQNHRHHSEETDDDVSLSNALETEEDDTEPTKSYLNESGGVQKPSKHSSKTKHNHDDEIEDLESLSQLLSERSDKKGNKKRNQNFSENRAKVERQLNEKSLKPKPSANAVPIGFQAKNSKNRKVDEEDDEEVESFETISDLDLESKNLNNSQNKRPKSGMKSSLQDSQSSSVWVSESQTNPHNNNDRKANHNLNRSITPNKMSNNYEYERPPTANSLKTSNFDSDEIETLG